MTLPVHRDWSADYIIKWYFGQSAFWINRHGDKVLISKMGDGHAINTLLMLERVAGDIEPLINSSRYAHIQETELYQALYKKVMAAVGEAMPPLADPEIEDNQVPEYRAPGLGDLIGAMFKGPGAEDGDSPVRKSWLDQPGLRPWVYVTREIERLLVESLQNDFDVVLDYTDREGRVTRNRRVRVSALREMQSITRPFPETRVLIKDRDEDNEVKTFYLSRINRARQA